MKIKKTEESISRVFDAEGNGQDTVSNASFQILDDGGAQVGNASAWNGGGNIVININGTASVAETEERIRRFLSVLPEED